MSQAFFTFDFARDDILANNWDLASETFYCHLVTQVPNQGDSKVSDFSASIPTYPAYAPVVATNNSFVAPVWKMDDFVFPVNDSGQTVNIVGSVICRQLGASPSTTDQPVVFQKTKQTNQYLEIPVSPNESITIKIDQTNGVLSRENRFIYNAGNYVSPLDTNGLVYLLGTRNSTLAYDGNRARAQISPLRTPDYTDDFGTRLVDRTLTNQSPMPNLRQFGIRFEGSNLISFPNPWRLFFKLQSFNMTSGTPVPFLVYGSQYLGEFPASGMQDNSFFSLIGSFSVDSQNNGQDTVFISDPITANDRYFKFLKIVRDPSFDEQVAFGNTTNRFVVMEVELYNCSVSRLTAF